MCKPSAMRAIEPNNKPPTISAIIMAPQSQITAHVLRSLVSCSAPRNTWLWKGEGASLLGSIMAPSFQIGADHLEEVFRRVLVQSPRMFVRVDEMCAHMILNHLGHETGHGAARAGDEMHHLVTSRFSVEGALDSLDLALDAAHARQQLIFSLDGMGHTRIKHPYPNP